MKSIQETKGKFRPQLTLWKQYWGPIQENPQKQTISSEMQVCQLKEK